MSPVTRRRIGLVAITILAVIALVSNIVLGFYVDRAQCRAAVDVIHNSRTMWEYLVEQNPGPEADKFVAEMDKRIPPGHCSGGRLVIERTPTITTTPPG